MCPWFQWATVKCGGRKMAWKKEIPWVTEHIMDSRGVALHRARIVPELARHWTTATATEGNRKQCWPPPPKCEDWPRCHHLQSVRTGLGVITSKVWGLAWVSSTYLRREGHVASSPFFLVHPPHNHQRDPKLKHGPPPVQIKIPWLLPWKDAQWH